MVGVRSITYNRMLDTHANIAEQTCDCFPKQFTDLLRSDTADVMDVVETLVPSFVLCHLQLIVSKHK